MQKYPAADRAAHLSLTELLGIRNNLLCERLVDATVAHDILLKGGESESSESEESEQPFRYGLLSLDVFEQLILR